MRESIPLSSILLYLKNPRLSESESEHESLCKMVHDQQRKLTLLAKDIAEHGMSELDLLAVFPAEKKGLYRVAEGNRRVSALKLLQQPELILKEYPLLSKEFSDISKRANIDYDHIDVVIFESEKDPKLVHFLQIRHLGENYGIGTVKWSATQKARFDYRTFGKENLVIFLDSLEEKGYLTREQIDGVTQTNWQRIFRPVGLACLKLERNGQSYRISKGFEKEFETKIKLIAESLKGESVAKVYGEPEIENFIAKIESKYQEYVNLPRKGSNVPDLRNTKTPSPNSQNLRFSGLNTFKQEVSEGTTDEEREETESEKESVNSNKIAEIHKRMPRDPYAKCKTVIPSSIRLQSRNHRINQIIVELKSLDVETYPNACGCLLRALIELSAKEYLEHSNKNPNYDATKILFEDAIGLATALMTQKNQLVAVEANAVKRETGSGGIKLLFNGYMHNTETYPSPVVIKGIFSTYSKFIKECLL